MNTTAAALSAHSSRTTATGTLARCTTAAKPMNGSATTRTNSARSATPANAESCSASGAAATSAVGRSAINRSPTIPATTTASTAASATVAGMASRPRSLSPGRRAAYASMHAIHQKAGAVSALDRAPAPGSGAGEAPTGGRRGGLVEPGALGDRLQQRARHLVGFLGLLQRGEALGGHLPRVLVLDRLQPGRALGSLVLVDVDALGACADELVDLLEEGVDELLGRHLAQRSAAAEDQALVLGPGDAEVGVRGLADAVDRAAEHGHLDRLLVGLQALLDVGHDRVHVELQAAARRAGDQHRATLAQLQRLEDLPGDLDLLLGVERGQRDADRVPHPVRQQRAEADGRLERAGPLRARLRDPEVERVLDLLRQQPV